MAFVKKKIKGFIKSKKINIFLLFLVLALLFSLLTKLSKDYTQTLQLDIEALNIPEDKVIIKDSSQKLNVTLTTYGFKLIRYHFSKPTIRVDFSNLERNDEFFLWTQQREFSNVVSQFDPNVKIVTVNPDSLKFRFDTNAVKSVPVSLNTEIEYASGYDIMGSFKLKPDSVRVIGPKILIDSFTTIQTRPLVLTDVKTDISAEIELVPPENEQLSLSDSQVEVNISVMKFTEGSVKVPILVKNVPEDVELNIYPKQIEVIYYASLETFKSVVPNNFIVECDYLESANAGINYLIPRLVTKPDEVKDARLSTKRIEFILQ
ncbi:MAG: YbbR-like domain-containing protein [Flavobacteriaceae bacterium]|nr:YbbR-like domain-containing protein [Bacteroidia bacterium]NNF74773.1 YbbR-like domain-containing protein [Flavobacteriaceae bacterium]NNK72500.1 YbbR-like domain-containing protein [Flavobacteriaceae bacterium]